MVLVFDLIDDFVERQLLARCITELPDLRRVRYANLVIAKVWDSEWFSSYLTENVSFSNEA